MALWDIMGKTVGMPLYKLLGGKYRETVPIVGLLKSAEPEAMGQEAKKYVNKGYQCLKVKIGFGVQQDVASVRAVREAVGEQIAIRVDAEECYDLKTSVKLARGLEEFNIELLSQPISRTNYHDMAVLRTIIDIPLR